VAAPLADAVAGLRRRGHAVHGPLQPWLRAALLERSDQLYAWTQAQLSPDELDSAVAGTPQQRLVRDALDAYTALAIDVEPLLPVEVQRWYRGLAR
jgi:hypothetical protein